MKLQTLLLRVSRNLRRLRLAAGLTHQSLAERTGLGESHVQRIEAGEANLTVDTVGHLAAGLGVDPAELVARAPPKRSASRAPSVQPPGAKPSRARRRRSEVNDTKPRTPRLR